VVGVGQFCGGRVRGGGVLGVAEVVGEEGGDEGGEEEGW